MYVATIVYRNAGLVPIRTFSRQYNYIVNVRMYVCLINTHLVLTEMSATTIRLYGTCDPTELNC